MYFKTQSNTSGLGHTQGRTPVRSHEVAFMKQRLEGELVKSAEIVQAIAALDRLQRHMSGVEYHVRKAAAGDR